MSCLSSVSPLTCFISGHVYGIPGRSVKLTCEHTTGNGREELVWSMYDLHWKMVARASYVDGTVRDTFYYGTLEGGLAELDQNGTLIIHSYDEWDAGYYRCSSEYRSAWAYLTTFGICILWIVCIIFQLVFVVNRMQVVLFACRCTTESY